MFEVIKRRERMGNFRPVDMIVVVGCGGIGGNIAIMAAMSDIKKLVLIDNDKLEPHNLNKVPLPAKYIGKRKVDALEEFIRNDLKSITSVSAYQMYVQNKDTLRRIVNEEIEQDIRTHTIVVAVDNMNVRNDLMKLNNTISLAYDANQVLIETHGNYEQGIDMDGQTGYTQPVSWCVPAYASAAFGFLLACTNGHQWASVPDEYRKVELESKFFRFDDGKVIFND